MQSLSQHVARERTADRLRLAHARRPSPQQTWHPPSRMRWRAASAVARLAWRLDEDAARLALK